MCLPTMVCLVIAVVFPEVIYGCESWTVRKAEHQRTDAFKLWCWRNTLESPLDCKEILPVHPKGDQSRCSLEGLMLKLKLQYFGHLMQRADSFEKTLMLGKTKGRRRRGRQRLSSRMVERHHRLNGHEFEQASGACDGWGSLSCCSPWGCKELDKTERLN